MSVPAFKNSRSKVRRRRSHHALKPVRVVKDKETGKAILPHHKAQKVEARAQRVKAQAEAKVALEVAKKASETEEKAAKTAVKQSAAKKATKTVRKAGRKK